MLIHITGPGGSGKTTLKNRLTALPGVLAIDLDDIDDEHSLSIIDAPGKLRINDFWAQHDTLNDIWTEQFDEPSKQIIVLVGVTIRIPHADRRYFIDIDPILARQRQIRRELMQIRDAMDELLASTEPNASAEAFNLCSLNMLYRHKIRMPVGQIIFASSVRKEYEEDRERKLERGYLCKTVDEIFEDIKKESGRIVTGP